MKNGLLKFCITIISVLAIVGGIDVVTDKAMNAALFHIDNVEQLGKTNYTLYELTAPIVIVGSSRASHHYDAKMISDSLGKVAYNAGRDGCFFTHNCCIINTILDRYSPEMIIWEFSPSYFCDHKDSMTSMYPYYGRLDYVTTAIDSISPISERVKLKSAIYRYNSQFLRVFTRMFFVRNAYDERLGYEPLPSKKLLSPLQLQDLRKESNSLNEKAISRFVETIKRAKQKGTKIIVVTSPIFGISKDTTLVNKLSELCALLDVKYMDCSQLYHEHPEYFNDISHMNHLGARTYTNTIIQHVL